MNRSIDVMIAAGMFKHDETLDRHFRDRLELDKWFESKPYHYGVSLSYDPYSRCVFIFVSF